MSKYPLISISVAADFRESFPDGDYTVGRGADPRGSLAVDARVVGDGVAEATDRKLRSKKKPSKSAAQAAE